ncbi:MAG: M15 family metallopeptidase [Candidatus Saccharibacteria bacterium]|nr:M15 family metallopeptidase [Candidatus Saccharibacteria bacterium]
MNRHNIFGLVLVIVVIVGSLIGLGFQTNVLSTNPDESGPGKRSSQFDEQAPAPFNTSAYSIDDATSPWVVVNKLRPLPDGYQPADLRAPNVSLRLGASSSEMRLRDEAATALEAMFAAAKEDGINLMIASAFRSQATQASLYNRYVSEDGQAAADTYSARPGHSEHQTGWALDVEPATRECEVEVCFGDLKEGQWVARRAHEFGFIIRYEQGNDALTGYTYEPWHIRYVGKGLAAELKATNQTMEQFFGLPAPVSYGAL